MEVSKEVLQKKLNFIAQAEKAGLKFIKKIMERIDLWVAVDEIEERFLPDGEKKFVLTIVDSMRKGQQVKVRKVEPVLTEDSKQSVQDKQNLH